MNKNLRYLQNVNVNGKLNNFQVHNTIIQESLDVQL